MKLKNEDIVRDIGQVVSSTCGCDFTSDRLTDSVFLCSSSSPNSVIYQAQLHGTIQANVYQLANIIHEEFYTKRKAICVQFSLLPVVEFCLVPLNTITPCDQITSTEEMSVSKSSPSETSSPEDTTAANDVVVVGLSVAIAVVVIVFLLISVILCINVIRKQ